MPKGKQLFIIFRIFHDLFTELAAAMLLLLPTSGEFFTLTIRITLLIIFIAIRYYLDTILYDKPE
jgi:hypothetical protein